MSYTPNNTNAPDVAQHVVNYGNATVPPSGAATADALVALVDALMDSFGTLKNGQKDFQCTGGSTASTSFVAATGYPNASIDVAVQKIYTLVVDLTFYATAADSIIFEVELDGAPLNPLKLMTVPYSTANAHYHLHFEQLVTCTPGTRVFSLLWKVGHNTTTVHNDATDAICWTLRG